MATRRSNWSSSLRPPPAALGPAEHEGTKRTKFGPVTKKLQPEIGKCGRKNEIENFKGPQLSSGIEDPPVLVKVL